MVVLSKKGLAKLRSTSARRLTLTGTVVLPRQAAGLNPVSLPPDFRQLSAGNCHARPRFAQPHFPRCLSKKRAISSNASLVSGALASR